MLFIAVLTYAAAMTSANLLVASFGPWVSPINSFFLIGLDLALRDFLHVRLSRLSMLLLVVSTGGIAYVLNPSAGAIAIASSVAFTAAALVDWAVFSFTVGSWLKRSNVSNAAGAAVDSVVFPFLAFGAFMPHVVLLQFVAKVSGGAVWSWCFLKVSQKSGFLLKNWTPTVQP